MLISVSLAGSVLALYKIVGVTDGGLGLVADGAFSSRHAIRLFSVPSVALGLCFGILVGMVTFGANVFRIASFGAGRLLDGAIIFMAIHCDGRILHLGAFGAGILDISRLGASRLFGYYAIIPSVIRHITVFGMANVTDRHIGAAYLTARASIGLFMRIIVKADSRMSAVAVGYVKVRKGMAERLSYRICIFTLRSARAGVVIFRGILARCRALKIYILADLVRIAMIDNASVFSAAKRTYGSRRAARLTAKAGLRLGMRRVS